MRISCVLLYSLFLSPKSVSAVRLYGDETDIRRLCAFLSVSLHETLKKVQTENRTNNKTFTKHNKVFARLFSKGGAVGGLTHTLRVCVNSREVRRSPTWHSSESESALERFKPVAAAMLWSDGSLAMFAPEGDGCLQRAKREDAGRFSKEGKSLDDFCRAFCQ